MPKLINEKRMLKTFVELVKIPSLSYKEGKVAKYLVKILKGLGCKVTIDKSAKKVGSDTGNIIATLSGTKKGAGPLVLSAHMDTVTPGTGIKPIIKGNRVYTNGSTILAADDKGGIAIILEVLRVLKENKKLKYPPLEIVFTTAEEPGVIGAKYLDYSKIKAKSGIGIDWLDLDEVVVQAPAKYDLDITVYGKAAHGGAYPEKGISALEVASKAISKLKMGRIDKETTSNLGLVKGGTTTNTVMPSVNLLGDARSHNKTKLDKYVLYLKKGFQKACKECRRKIDGKIVYPKLDFKSEFMFKNYSIDRNSSILKTLEKSAKKNKTDLKFIKTNGCLEANHFCAKGITTATLGMGVKNVHTTKEELNLKHFYKCANIVLDAIVDFK